MITHIPPGYTKVRILKDTTYARELLERGALAVLDTGTATRLIQSKHAEAIEPEPARAMIATSCPKCHAAMEYPETPAANERWAQCQACGFGWLR